MSVPQPASIVGELGLKVRHLVETATSYLDPKEFELRRLLRSCEKLASAEPYHASIFRAQILHLSGDLEGALYWLRNAERFPWSQRDVDAHAACLLSNLGYFSVAAERFRRTTLESWGDVSLFCDIGSLLACWDHLLKFSAALPMELGQAIDQARSVLMILDKCASTTIDVSAVLDLAGEVLRRHSLFFTGTTSVVHCLNNEDGAGMLYELVVPVGSEQAVQMTDEVLDMMIERDLVRTGLAFSFLPAK